MGKLNQTTTQVQELLDKVTSAQNAEKSATDLALMRDVARRTFSSVGDFVLSTLDDGNIAILGIKNQINFDKVAAGDIIFIGESSGEFQLHLSVLSSALKVGASYLVSGQVMGILMTQDGTKIVAGRFNAARPASSTEFTNVAVILSPSVGDENALTPKLHEQSFLQTGNDGEFICESDGVPVFDNIQVGDIMTIDVCDPGNNVFMRITGTVANIEGAIGLHNVLAYSYEKQEYASLLFFNIYNESPTKYYFYNTDLPIFNAQRMWKFEAGESANAYIVPDGWADNAKTGDYVNLYDEYFGFVSELASGNVGGRLVMLGRDAAIHVIGFKNGRLSSNEKYSIPSNLDSRLKTLEKASVTLTQDEYDTLAKKDPDTTYYITDNGGLLQ